MFNLNKLHFTSDFLFRDIQIAKQRGYSNFEDMEVDLINEWNSKVQYDDTIYYLGNFSRTVKGNIQSYSDLIQELNGIKHFILGPSDDKSLFEHLRTNEALNIASVSDYRELSILGRKIILMHYPIALWNGRRSSVGSFHLYGGHESTDIKNSLNISYLKHGRILKISDIKQIINDEKN